MNEKPLHRINARNRKGRCYELAGRGIMEDASWTLVHGVILDGLVGHAWLERDGICYDVVLDAHEAQDAYLARHKAVAECRYTQQEAAEQVISSGHWGPWHESGGYVAPLK